MFVSCYKYVPACGDYQGVTCNNSEHNIKDLEEKLDSNEN